MEIFHTEVAAEKDLLAGLDQLFAEMPATEPSHPVDLAKIIIEDRE